MKKMGTAGMVKDIVGREVTEGDRIAVAMAVGNRSSGLYIARVMELREKTIKILWEGERKPTHLQDFTKILVINEISDVRE